jgi:pyruvate/2-oxoglutarate/acetoin dehydrogenase E1 component
MASITYLEAIREALREEMRRDPSVFLLGEDIGVHGGSFKVTKGLIDEFGPERIKDTPISEGTIVGAAMGAAMNGLRPVAEIMFVDWITLAMDQVVNQAAKASYMFCGQYRVPLVIRAPSGGGGGKGTAAQHTQNLEAWFAHVPGLKVVIPGTPYDAKGLLKTAIRDDNPVLFLEQKALYAAQGDVPEGDYTVPFGAAKVVREGHDATVVTFGAFLHEVLKAVERLEEEGIGVEVIDLRTLKPLDMETIYGSVRKTNRVVIAHEAVRGFGAGAEIAANIAEEAIEYLAAPIQRVGAADVPVPFNNNEEARVLPQAGEVQQKILKLVRDYPT